ncbi:TlpA family protein disulfide reductase [Agaribacter flavus]|uniref:TlpA family protein disulfide reductase n=1 Tax=Agaribacter flavus TaxID=1902781 RepID=A0ABV7FSV6_9ALTE
MYSDKLFNTLRFKALYIVAAIASILFGAYFYKTNQYDFKTLDDQKFSLASLKGDYVLINYFAEWCAPCLREIPELSAFNRIKGDNVKLFAMSYDQLSRDKLQELKNKYEMDFPLITDIKTSLPFEAPKYLPATFVINPDGSVAGQLLGEQTVESLLEVTP